MVLLKSSIGGLGYADRGVTFYGEDAIRIRHCLSMILSSNFESIKYYMKRIVVFESLPPNSILCCLNIKVWVGRLDCLFQYCLVDVLVINRN